MVKSRESKSWIQGERDLVRNRANFETSEFEISGVDPRSQARKHGYSISGHSCVTYYETAYKCIQKECHKVCLSNFPGRYFLFLFFFQFLQFSVSESGCFRYTFARERVCIEFEDSFPVYVFFTKQNLADFALAVLVYTKPIIPLSVGA